MPQLIQKLKHYFANLALIWLAILFYRYNHYYLGFLRSETQTTLLYLAIAYTAIGFFMYILIPVEKTRQAKGYVLLSASKRFIKELWTYTKNFTLKPEHPFPKVEHHEKTALLFVIVKIFFLPIMINFFFNNYFSITSQINSFAGFASLFTISQFNSFIYPFLISLFFLIDTLYFSFGYAVELDFLKNKVRSVEPTLFGWIVAIICYPPFNDLLGSYTNWYANDRVIFFNEMWTFVFRIILLLLVFVYLWATLALGAKSSNLTNRGIVTRGPYRFIRHPAYISKNLVWWLTILPVFSLIAVVSMTAWSIIYLLRAITEERHLIREPDYQEYCKKVRYRFIPYVF